MPAALTLDHLTVADAPPWRAAELAAANGCDGAGLFLHAMTAVPAMPAFSLLDDAAALRATRDALRAGGVALRMAYPFTLGARTDPASLEPALEAVASLGGRHANLLCYDRDRARLLDGIARLAELARGHGVALSLEFYPASAVKSLADASALLGALGRDDVALTVDLLHLHRVGEMPDALASLAVAPVALAQLCDGPASAPADAEREAGEERLLPGEGMFDVAGFIAALPAGCPISVEAPRGAAIRAGLPPEERARRAIAAARAAVDAAAARRGELDAR